MPPTAVGKSYKKTLVLGDPLSKDVHRLLSLSYVRDTLEAIEDEPEGRSTRWIDVKVVGVEGSSRTASNTVAELERAGWIAKKQTGNRSHWILTDLGRDALRIARIADSVGTETSGDKS